MPLTQVQGGMLAGSTNTTTTIQSNGTTAITIDSSQNVGIGTASPSAFGAGYTSLCVNGSTAPIIDLFVNGTRSASFNGTSTYSQVSTVTNTPLLFGTNATERGRFDTSGNFLFNSGYGSVATAYGCRAWVYFDPSGSILASGNVSSVSKNSTGNYTVSFTNAMPSSNYSAVATCDIGGWNAGNTQTGGYNTGSISIQTRNTSMTATDASVSLAIFR